MIFSRYRMRILLLDYTPLKKFMNYILRKEKKIKNICEEIKIRV